MKLSNKYEREIKKDDWLFKQRVKARKKKKTHKNNDKLKIPYKEQLQDCRWKKKREDIFKQKGRVCLMCGSVDNLQIHHLRYLKNKLAWEYDSKDLIVLCCDCHKKKHCIDLDEEFKNITSK